MNTRRDTSLQDLLDTASRHLLPFSAGFPHYNIVQHGENGTHYSIVLALAGYKKENIAISRKESSLLIEGTPSETKNDQDRLVYNGIANRRFSLSFGISRDIHVRDATFEDGLLIIKVERIVPEHLRSQQIEIRASQPVLDQPS